MCRSSCIQVALAHTIARNRTSNEEASVQVNIPADSGEMGVLANHVPSIEQLKPGLVEVIEESGGSKQFFCKDTSLPRGLHDCNVILRRICTN